LGKDGPNLEHAQGVDPSSFDSIDATKRLEYPIDTPIESHDDRHKEEHKERDAHPGMGNVDPRDATVDGKMRSFGCIESLKGINGSFECDNS